MHNYGSVFRTVASGTIDRTDNRYDNAVEFIIARLDASHNLGRPDIVLFGHCEHFQPLLAEIIYRADAAKIDIRD